MSSLREQLLHNLSTGVDYRHSFVEEKIRTGLAVQIRAIREQRKMNQGALARLLNKSQSWVSRLEDPNKAIPTIPTLLILAKAFDVDLEVRFVPFSEMISRLVQLTPEAHEVASFANDSFNSAGWPIVSNPNYPRKTKESEKSTGKLLQFSQASNRKFVLEGQGNPDQLSDLLETSANGYNLAAGGGER
jgi:transcriptional regulator with XRE-family HTH domain